MAKARNPSPDVAALEAEVAALRARVAELEAEAADARTSGAASFRAVVDQAEVGIVQATPTGRLVDANPAFLRLVGYTRDELLGKNVADITPPADVQVERRQVLGALKRGESVVQLTKRYVRRDGGTVWVRAALSVMRDSAGRATTLYGIVEDITARMEAEEALRASALAFQSVVEASPLGIHMYRLEDGGRLVFTGSNPAAERILGLDHAALVGQTIEEAFPNLAGTEVPARYREAAADGTPWQTEQVTYEDDRVAGAFEVHAFQTAPGQMVAMFRDVTERARAEEALRESERRFHAIFDQTFQFVGLLRPDGTLLEANQTALDAVGCVAAEVRGVPFWESPWWAHSTAEQARVQEDVARAAAGEVVRHDITYRTAQGTERVLDFSLKPLVDDDGQVALLIPEGRDVTELRAAEATARADRELLEAVLRFVPQALFVKDRAGRYLYVNPSFEALSAAPADLFLGRTDGEIEEVALVSLSPRGQSTRVSLSPRGQSTPGQSPVATLRRADGETREVVVTTAPFRGAAGGAAGTVGALTDVSELRHAERDLLERERTIRGLLRAAPVGIALVQGRVIASANARLCEMLGYGEEELVGRHPRMFFINDEAFEEASRTIAEGVRAGGTVTVEARWRTKAWTPLQVLLGCAAVDPADLARGVVYAAMDVSGQRALEERLRQAERMESVGRLAGGVAHDFNNLLAPIIGYAELLLADTGLADPVRTRVTAMHRAAERARDLTRQLLVFARKQGTDVGPINLNEAIQGFSDILRRTIREDVDIHLALAPRVAAVRADRSQVELLLMNLAVNARDAMPTGGTLTIETAEVVLAGADAAEVPELAPGRYVLLSVSDTGMGMPPEVVERVFEPFFTTKAAGRGTGLGLAAVYGIVQQHGGAIRVTSRPGRGTTFSVYLPRAEEEATAADEAREVHPSLGGDEAILVVEDDEAVRQMVGAVLHEHGYHPICLGSAEECLRYLTKTGKRADLLLTDVVLPGMNGRELYEALRAEHPTMKVAYMSGYAEDILWRGGSPHEHAAFIQKPFALEDLVARVREVLDAAG